MSAGAINRPEDTPRRKGSEGQVVPAWMIAVMAILFVAVVGLSAFLIWGLEPSSPSAPEAEIAKLRTLSKRDSEDAQIRSQLAYALQRQGQYREAAKIYEGVLQMDDANLGAMYNRGVCLMQLGNESGGASSFKDVLSHAPTHTLAAEGLGRYYYDHGEYLLAVQALGPAVAAHPTISDLQALLGEALEQVGEFDKAIEHYQAALDTDPEQQEAREGLKRLEVRAK